MLKMKYHPFELEVTSIDSDGMSLEIALPYTTTNSDDLRCDVPGYDRDATELLLMALVNDKRKKYFANPIA